MEILESFFDQKKSFLRTNKTLSAKNKNVPRKSTLFKFKKDTFYLNIILLSSK